jgi:succinoglycan biosynthesis protein ExoV
MKLRYFESPNFGDALNPYIFNTLLPGLFNNDSEIDFFGIGSIIGFDFLQKAKKKIIFSSGFAYGTKPNIDASYDIVCVRGPLTARALHIDPSLAIADGAVLLKYFDFPEQPKAYDFSFVPHWESELKFEWRSLCENMGIHYISPMQSHQEVIQEILKSKVVLAEAMHAAIVADALRVPWIPVRAYPSINEFKWQDWALSVKVNFQPSIVPSLFDDNPFVRNLCRKKITSIIPLSLYGMGVRTYKLYQTSGIIPKVERVFNDIKKREPYLSPEKMLNYRGDQLREKIELVKKKYGSHQVY